jgi:hypothetical protein
VRRICFDGPINELPAVLQIKLVAQRWDLNMISLNKESEIGQIIFSAVDLLPTSGRVICQFAI